MLAEDRLHLIHQLLRKFPVWRWCSTGSTILRTIGLYRHCEKKCEGCGFSVTVFEPLINESKKLEPELENGGKGGDYFKLSAHRVIRGADRRTLRITSSWAFVGRATTLLCTKRGGVRKVSARP